jgi:hypothetical protein
VRTRFFTARASGATLKQAVDAADVSKTTGHNSLTRAGAPARVQQEGRSCGCRGRTEGRYRGVWLRRGS